MKGFVKNIEAAATENTNFQQVLYAAQHCKPVVMSLQPGEDSGFEIHKHDEFFCVDDSKGEAILDGTLSPISAGFAVLVPEGVRHNIVNSGKVPLKLYTLYSPPNHRDGVIHTTRHDAGKDTEHFDDKVTARSVAIIAGEHGGSIQISYRSRMTLRITPASLANELGT